MRVTFLVPCGSAQPLISLGTLPDPTIDSKNGVDPKPYQQRDSDERQRAPSVDSRTDRPTDGCQDAHAPRGAQRQVQGLHLIHAARVSSRRPELETPDCRGNVARSGDGTADPRPTPAGGRRDAPASL